MLYSNIFSKTSKTTPADADCVNAKLLTQAGFISKQMAGVYNYLPLGLRVLTKIQNIIREEMNALGANEVLMPALQSDEPWKKTDRWDVDIMFKLKGREGKDFCLGWSHEEVVTPLVQQFVSSYRDLPVATYQIQNKYRNEPRAKSGILRGREFNMKDLYSFHTTEDDLNKYYEQAKQAYFKVYDRLGIKDITVYTFASGGEFSKYAHEFQTLSEVGEDTIYLCEKCNVAINKEIIHEQKTCPECDNKDLIEKKAIEVGNIFKLKTRFSNAFDFKYVDENGKEQPITMGCYGIGISRLMGTLVEVFHDDRGMIWPESVAPYKIHLVSLAGKDEKVVEAADKLYQELLDADVEVLYDNRSASAGEKLGDVDLIGCPIRLVVSKKTLEKDSVEVKKRGEEDFKIIKFNQVLSNI